MERVVKYVNDKLKHAGHSKEAHSQKEELIAGLHDKISDAMSKGKSEDEAFDEAVASLDGMEELTQALNTKRRTVYVNKLKFHHSLLLFGLIALEILACGVYAHNLMFWLIRASSVQSLLNLFYVETNTVIFTLIGFGIAFLAVIICALVRGILYRTNPEKVEQMEFDFRERVRYSILGGLAMALVLSVLTLSPTARVEGPVLWFIWPILAITDLPLSVLLYSWLYRRKKYLAKQ